MTRTELDALKARVSTIKTAAGRVPELEQAVSTATKRMSTIANLFSASMWALLPQEIKTYFEEYRE